MRIGALYSGGKDSTYALHWAFLQGHDIACLLTVYPEARGSWLFHYSGLEAVKYQARAMNIPLIYKVAKVGEKSEEKALDDIIYEAIRKYKIEALVAGALLSDYQRMRISMVAEKYGLPVHTPLWRINQEKYLCEVIRHGIKFIIISLSVYGLPKDLVGKIIDLEYAEKIISLSKKIEFNPAFEGGEAETLVVDAPLFKKKLKVIGKRIDLGPYEAIYDIEHIYLEDKTLSSYSKL